MRIRRITLNELANIYDRHVGGRSARTMPIAVAINWALTREDLFTVDEHNNICVIEDEQPKRSRRMKYSTIGVMLGRKGPFTFRVPDEDGFAIKHSDLQEDDYVVVETQYGITAGLVVDVHDECLDDGPYNYRWAFQKVDESWCQMVKDQAEAEGIEPA